MITSSNTESVVLALPQQRGCRNALMGTMVENFRQHIAFTAERVDDEPDKKSLERMRIKAGLFALGRQATENIAELDCSKCETHCSALELLGHVGVEVESFLQQHGISREISIAETDINI